jgi:putative ABC transport system substrate-binding protein
VSRREFITLLGGAAAAWPLAALGQQQPAKLARTGLLRAAGADNKDFTAFRIGLRALGIVIEQRYGAGSYDRVGELAAELVRLNVDVIVVDGPAAAKPAKAATADILVFVAVTAPIGSGFVASMARPGGNITGFTSRVIENHSRRSLLGHGGRSRTRNPIAPD